MEENTFTSENNPKDQSKIILGTTLPGPKTADYCSTSTKIEMNGPYLKNEFSISCSPDQIKRGLTENGLMEKLDPSLQGCGVDVNTKFEGNKSPITTISINCPKP